MAEPRQIGNRPLNWGNPSEWEGGQNPDEIAEWGQMDNQSSFLDTDANDMGGIAWQQPDPFEGRASMSPRESFGGGQGPTQAPDVALRATGANPGQPFGSGGGEEGQSSQSPRERLNVPGLMAPGGTSGGATPARPRSPQPEGGVFTATAPGPVQGAAPAIPGIGSGMGTRLRGLFGSQGGLQGGGLGLPMQTSNNAASDPIETLLSTITSKRRILS